MEQKDDQAQNDRIMAQLYKKGAKEAPSSELDRKILDYAAKKSTPAHGSSHFGGGWKVPLSLAASVVLVFAILVQLDQSPEQLEIPPIPTADKSDVESVPLDETTADDFNRSIGADSDIGLGAEESVGRTEPQAPPATTQGKLESRKKLEQQETLSHPERPLEKSRQLDDSQLNNELKMEQEAPTSPPSVKSKAPDMPAADTTKPNKTLERMQDSSKDVLNEQKQSTLQEGSRSTNGAATGAAAGDRSMDLESNQPQQAQEPMMRDREDAPMAEEEADFAPMPIEDWLLMIEQLIAKKDYAQAHRQLEKFKQAHPDVNVDDLESKIP